MQLWLQARSAKLILAAVLAILVLLFQAPHVVRAGEPHGAPPAAISFSESVAGAQGGREFVANMEGVFNTTGEGQLMVTVTRPEEHTFDLVRVNGTEYLSVDGAPFETFALDQDLSQLPAGCEEADRAEAMTVQPLENLVEQLQPSLTPVGEEVVDGVPTRHLHGEFDLGALFSDPTLLESLTQVGSACGEPPLPLSFDPSLLSQATAGATLELDAYLEQPGDFPRRITAALAIPAVDLDVNVQADLTPLDAPVPIAPPAP